jgi:hypothetical protein
MAYRPRPCYLCSRQGLSLQYHPSNQRIFSQCGTAIGTCAAGSGAAIGTGVGADANGGIGPWTGV